MTVRRLRSGDPLIDLREARPDDLRDLSALHALVEPLAAFQPSLRVWVLPDEAAAWAASPDALDRAMLALHRLRRRGEPDHARAGDAAVLLPGAAACLPLCAALWGLAITPYGLRSGGGLPIQEIVLEGTVRVALSGAPLPPGFPESDVMLSAMDGRVSLQGRAAQGDRVAAAELGRLARVCRGWFTALPATGA